MRFTKKLAPLVLSLAGGSLAAASCTVADKADYTFEDEPSRGGNSGSAGSKGGKAGGGGSAGKGGSDGSGGDPGGADGGGRSGSGGSKAGGGTAGATSLGGEGGEALAPSEGGSGGALPDNPCDPNPCENGACTPDGDDGYACDCDDGFEGPRCQTNTDDCATDPCLHGGTCTDAVDDYVCDCSGTGYTGKNCQTLPNASCDDMPCAHGTCTNVMTGGFLCDCTGTGYEGDACDIDIDECARELDNCHRYARCDDRDGTFTCSCPPPYQDVNRDGTNCELYPTCSALHSGYPELVSSFYPLQSLGGTIQDAYCDMSYNGGGYTNLDFTNRVIWLLNGNYIACAGGLTATQSSFVCYQPNFNNSYWLYQYECFGADSSVDYILDYVGPTLGLPGYANLGGWTGMVQYYEYGIGIYSDPTREYCYIVDRLVQWQDPACAAYQTSTGNGYCTPTFLQLYY
jgi:hypothetical protein